MVTAGAGLLAPVPLTLDNCTVSNNVANIGGGLYVWADGALTIANSTVTGNIAALTQRTVAACLFNPAR